MNNEGLTLNQLAERNAELVTEVEKLRSERDQLAAENVALKSSRAILAENALESCNSIACAGFRHEAIMRGLYASTGNGNKYPKPITTLVDEAMRKLETPATDRIVAAQRSAFVDEAVANITESGALTFGDCIVALCQLREGADK